MREVFVFRRRRVPWCAHTQEYLDSDGSNYDARTKVPTTRIPRTNDGRRLKRRRRATKSLRRFGRIFLLEYFVQQYLNVPNAFCPADRRHQNSIKTTESGASRQRLFMAGKNRTRPLGLGLYRSTKPLHTHSGTLSMQPAFLRSESPATYIHG